MKKVISLILVVLTIFALVSCSCIRGDSKYDYKDLTEYIKLPNFREHLFEFEEDAIKQAIGAYLLGTATEYTIQNGDRINVTMNFYPTKFAIDTENPISDIFSSEECANFVIESLGTDDGNGSYTLSKTFEEALVGKNVSDSTFDVQIYKDSTFIKEEYRNEIIYIRAKVISFEGEGDVISEGDKVTLSLEFYKSAVFDAADRDREIKELFQDKQWIEKVNRTDENGNYQYSKLIEEELTTNVKVNATISRKFTLDDTFFNKDYVGQTVYVDITVNNIECELGDVVIASYTGYYIDEEGNIIQEDGKDKTFDSSDSSKFYLGSHLAIEDLEQGMVGMEIGVEKEIYATFPENYTTKPELAGVKTLFKVTVKSLYTPPAYDDKFVQTYFTDFANIEEFEASLRKEYILTLVLDYILENVQIIEYPKAEYRAAEKQLEEIEGTFAANMQMTLDEYISSEYDMTRDAYIKSNMKTEMIYYALRNLLGESVVPTEEELALERDTLIASYKEYYMTNEGLDETSALTSAKDFVDKLGESYIYEEVLYVKVETALPDLVKVKTIPAPFDNYIFDAQDK